MEETEVVELPFKEKQGDNVVFEKEIIPMQTGKLGYAVRVCPNHFKDPMTRPVTSLLKWSGK